MSPRRPVTSQTTYSYDTTLTGLRQQRIYHKPDVEGSDSWDSTFSYDANGRLARASRAIGLE